MAEKKNTGNMSKDEVTKILKNIGDMIQAERAKKGWSMAQLAEISGISSSLISDLENNKGKVPNIFTLISIARALNLTDDEFIKAFWAQTKPVVRRKTERDKEDEVRTALLEYGIPSSILKGIMDYINIIVKLSDLYESCDRYELYKTIQMPHGSNCLYEEKQYELLKYFAEFAGFPQDRFDNNWCK